MRDVPGRATLFRIVPGPGKTGGSGLSTLRRDVLDAHLADGWRLEELQVEVVPLERVLDDYIPYACAV
ncbi:hypothetical protein OG979_36295 [Actinomadura citrea]|uniref:hypothetical protein n=1 Tax=Actinomadura citrea TaxID=46158 RepID=UPI002E284B95|nr:hypothetical protein [Actinomadura citrea]